MPSCDTLVGTSPPLLFKHDVSLPLSARPLPSLQPELEPEPLPPVPTRPAAPAPDPEPATGGLSELPVKKAPPPVAPKRASMLIEAPAVPPAKPSPSPAKRTPELVDPPKLVHFALTTPCVPEASM